jgi:CYTH domain-containing protein
MEIERKWLVDKTHLGMLIERSHHKERIEQYYLSGKDDEWTIRLRKSNSEYFLTLKSKGLLSREEIETVIHRGVFLNDIKHAKTSIKKIRYTIEIDKDLSYEIDVYDDFDFVTCEVEFKSEEEANGFVTPSWCLEDVTYDSKYKNSNLAK